MIPAAVPEPVKTMRKAPAGLASPGADRVPATVEVTSPLRLKPGVSVLFTRYVQKSPVVQVGRSIEAAAAEPAPTVSRRTTPTMPTASLDTPLELKARGDKGSPPTRDVPRRPSRARSVGLRGVPGTRAGVRLPQEDGRGTLGEPPHLN